MGTPIKIKTLGGFEYPSDKLNSEKSNKFDNQNEKESDTSSYLSTKKNTNDEKNLKSKSPLKTLKKVDSNKAFFSRRKSSISKHLETDEVYKQKEFCKKYCGEKLFKDLDLNQRFYLKKSGEVHMHNENCPFFKQMNKNKIKNSCKPVKFREKRKIEVEKNLSLLDFSLSGVRSRSLFENNNNTKSKGYMKFNESG